MIPPAVLDALQEHIDRTLADLYKQYGNNAEACNAFQAGQNLGRLQEWLLAQRQYGMIPDHPLTPKGE